MPRPPDRDSPDRASGTTTPVDNNEAIRPKTLAEAEKERQKANCIAMDEMEASAESQGIYFAKFGQKTEDSDNRVLVMRSGFIALTPDGPKRIVWYEPTIGGRNEEEDFSRIIKRRIDMENAPDEAALKAGFDLQSKTMSLSVTEEDGEVTLLDLNPRDRLYRRETNPASLEEVTHAIKKSIEATEAPVKKIEAKTEQATLLSEQIRNLSPRI